MIKIVRFLLQIKIMRYLIAGTTAAFVDFFLLFLFTEFLGVWYLFSAVAAFICSFAVSFTLQKFWTFGDMRTNVIPRQIALHFTLGVSMLAANTALLYILVDFFDMWYMAAQFFVAAGLAMVSFVIYNTIIFEKNASDGGIPADSQKPRGDLFRDQEKPVFYAQSPEYGSVAKQLNLQVAGQRSFLVYIGTPLPRPRHISILGRHLNMPFYRGKKPFRAVYDAMDFSFLELVLEPTEADFFLLPHSYFSARAVAGKYVEDFIRLAWQMKKRVILFSEGDTDESIRIPHAVVFRTSQYAHKKAPNEIMMPPQVYSEDVLSDSVFVPRAKRDKPVVSFCGWSELGSARQQAKFFIKNAYADFRTAVLRDPYAEPRKQGIYFRQKAMKTLARSPVVETSFVTRDFFSVNKHTIKRPREELRAEYLENIRHSDFVLAPKGDGNFSIRFYEALAMGRIPVLVDTDCSLPLEGEIDYRSCAVRVPHLRIGETDKYITDFYNRLDTEAYGQAQLKARTLFTTELRLDVFLKNVLTKLFPA